MPKLLILAFLQVKLKKNAKTINSGVLQVKLKKNAKINSSSILICKIFKKKCQNYSSSIFTSKIEKKTPKLLVLVFYIYKCISITQGPQTDIGNIQVCLAII
jgi:hypothetical protein